MNISSITVDSGALLDMSYLGTGTVTIGDDLITNASDGLHAPGEIDLGNTGTILLAYRPTITNNGLIKITATNANGLMLVAGDRVVTILNSGTIDKTAGSTYAIADPVSNKTTNATIEVDSGTLAFQGADPTTGYSVTQSTGTIQLSTTLEADYGIDETGGAFNLLVPGSGAGNIQVTNPNKEFLLAGGSITLGGTNPNFYGYLTITGNFKFTSGTINLFWPLNLGAAQYITASGTTGANISNPGATTVNATFYGTGNTPAQIKVLQTPNGSIDNTAQNNPAGYTAARINNNKLYVLNKQGASPIRYSSSIQKGSPRPGARSSSGFSAPLFGRFYIKCDNPLVHARGSILRFAYWVLGRPEPAPYSAGFSSDFWLRSRAL